MNSLRVHIYTDTIAPTHSVLGVIFFKMTQGNGTSLIFETERVLD